jgi:long-chain acyl-CoA synthetase
MTSAEFKPDTFPALLLQHAKQRGGHAAVREKRRGIWHSKSWRELRDEAAALATALSGNGGLQPGERVALLGEPSARLYAATCAVQGVGAVVVPLSPDADAQTLAPLLRRAAITHAFAENQEQVDKLLEIQPACPTLRRIVYDQDRGMRHYKQDGLTSYADLLALGWAKLRDDDMGSYPVAHTKGTDTAALFFPEGGPDEGLALSHSTLIERVRASAAAEGLRETDVAVVCVPPHWIANHLGSYAQALVAGYCVACPESGDTLFADLREIGPTYLVAPPRMLETLLSRTSERMGDAGRIKRGLYDRCIALAKRKLSGEPLSTIQRTAYTVADWLIYGPLRDVLGMSRVRVVYACGDVDADLPAFFRSIGINLKQARPDLST